MKRFLIVPSLVLAALLALCILIAAEPDALESGDGAGGRDGRVAVFRRNLLY